MLVGKPPCSPAPSRICRSSSTRSAIVLLRRTQPGVCFRHACRPEARSGTVLVANRPPWRGTQAQLTHLTGSLRAKPAEVVSKDVHPGSPDGTSYAPNLVAAVRLAPSSMARQAQASRKRQTPPEHTVLRGNTIPRAHNPATSTPRFCWYPRGSVVFCVWERWPW